MALTILLAMDGDVVGPLEADRIPQVGDVIELDARIGGHIVATQEWRVVRLDEGPKWHYAVCEEV